MSSCCGSTLDYAAAKADGTFTVALAGNPNSGKTTIFNGLTGLRQHVANYPGVTVEKKTGRCKLPSTDDGRPARWIDVIDLPGTYSLISRSPDEQVAMEVLRGLRPDTPPPDAVIVVVDASNLQRNLYLVSQLVELGRPLVVALNMMDVAERRGIQVSPEALQRELGVPVIPLVGHKKKGIDDLKRAIAKAAVAPMPNWPLPEAMKEELLLVGGGLAILAPAHVGATPASPDSAAAITSDVRARPASPAGADVEQRAVYRTAGDAGVAPTARRIADPATQAPPDDPQPVPPRAWICRDDSARTLDRYQAIAERLLIGDHAPDVADLANRQPVASLLNAAMTRLQSLGIDPMQADIEAHYRWIEGVASRASSPPEHLSVAIEPGGSQILPYESKQSRTLTQKVDAILVHKVWGLLIFAAIMGALFVSIFWLAKPIMDGISSGIDAVGAWAAHSLSDGPVKSLITDGIFKGVGAVVVFVPQIAMLFLFLAVLEDTGYLARAAFLMDRLLAKVGLHGKSFIPLLSSFACAIPGIMATRTIENRKDRLATIFIAPFMSCSARLPVYTLLIGTFFAQYSALARGGIMLGCYALGIVAAVVTAWIFKRSFLKGPAQAFILELPTYKLPQLSQIARQVWFNTSKFLTKAGTTIFCLSVILWALSFYPRMSEPAQATARAAGESRFDGDFDAHTRDGMHDRSEEDMAATRRRYGEQAVAAAQSEYSFAGRFGHTIEPAIRPLGFDWKMGVGLVGAFAAREVFVSTMGITYSVGQVEDDTGSLADAMRADHYADGRPVWTPLVAISLLVWFVLAMQCMSTMAIVRRETGGWKWPIIMLVYMNALAYVASLAVFQFGSLFLKG